MRFVDGTPPAETYTLSLHDALPIFVAALEAHDEIGAAGQPVDDLAFALVAPLAADYGNICQCGCFPDRKSTRLNSSHSQISYAGFCLKKRRVKRRIRPRTRRT